MEYADKEFTVLCDLARHTLTNKGNPDAGGHEHARMRS